MSEDKSLREELEKTNRRLADLRDELASLEMDFIHFQNFMLQYIANERAALMSIAKYTDGKGHNGRPN